MIAVDGVTLEYVQLNAHLRELNSYQRNSYSLKLRNHK
jgi:hypothetical protein